MFNIGNQDQIEVTRIAEILIEKLGLSGTVFKYTGGDGGWSGDVPRMMLSTERLNNLGWKAKYSSEEEIEKASQALIEEIWKKNDR